MRKRRKTRIDMTSLMDVMFLVLVFFIYSIFSMSVHKGVKVDLPNAVGRMEKGESIVITIRPDDTLQLNGRDMSREEILSRLAQLRAAKVELPVLLSGDRKSSLGGGIGLLSDLKAVGFDKVSFLVDGAKSTAPRNAVP